MNRRDFLSLSIVGMLASCQIEPSRSGNATASPFKLPAPTAVSSDWSALAKSLQGTLVRSDSPQYATACQLFSPRFDSVLPEAIAYCVSPADVQVCLAFVHRFGLPFALRAGGHSFAGYSTTTGLVLDITHMSTVKVDASTGIATIGAGARLKDLIITHKFLEPPVERDAKAEIMPCLFNATWLATMVRKNVPKDMGNDKLKDGGLLVRVSDIVDHFPGFLLISTLACQKTALRRLLR